MESTTVWLGVDVGKTTCIAALDIPTVDGSCERKAVMDLPVFEFVNTSAGAKKMLLWAERKIAATKNTFELKLVMESTGIYSRHLENFLQTHRPELTVIIENANLIRSYRLSLNLKNETDFLDARAIAYYGGDRQPIPPPQNSKCYSELCEICRLREFYVKQLVSYKNMHEVLESPMLKRMDTTVIKTIQRKINDLNREIAKFVMTHDELREEAEIMITVPGIAILTAAILLGELGSLKNYGTRNKIAAIAGLNPQIKESGTSIRKSKLSKKGSSLVRKILYIDCTTAIKGIPFLTAFHQRLISKGKSRMTAKCACMRKLLLILRSMVINNQPFDQDYMKKNKLILDD